MPIPNEPVDLIPRPFAELGERRLVPDAKPFSGAASYQQGFPPETQLPLVQGGIAPNRLDFQGLFNVLTSFAFWQQSGGLFTWKAGLNYSAPCMVFYEGNLWWAVAPSGPDTGGGVVVPGTDENTWVLFLKAVAKAGGGLVPVGSMNMWPTPDAPEGYFPCNDYEFDAALYPQLYAVLGRNRTPDMRGMFVRGYDPEGVVDPDGTTRQILSTQSDAGINLTGAWRSLLQSSGDLFYSGCVKPNSVLNISGTESRSNLPETPEYSIDASRQWGQNKISTEFRPVNKSVLFIIKHD